LEVLETSKICLPLDIEDCYIRYKREGLLLFSGRKVEAEEKEFFRKINPLPFLPSSFLDNHV
jgi:hypothetical protein